MLCTFFKHPYKRIDSDLIHFQSSLQLVKEQVHRCIVFRPDESPASAAGRRHFFGLYQCQLCRLLQTQKRLHFHTG